MRLEREVDVFIAREHAESLAAEIGFDAYQRSDIETAVSELATNAIKYGQRGWASLRTDGSGFEAAVSDEGPGFGAAPKSRSGLGVGLAGVERLMDSLEIHSGPTGSRVCIRKELRPSKGGDHSQAWLVEAVSRTRSGKAASGDMMWLHDMGATLLLAVIDGLGSGEPAAMAAGAVSGSFQASSHRSSIPVMLSNAHREARSTRGAVCLLLRIDDSHHTLEYAGVGDVAGYADPPGVRLASSPGIIGVDEPLFNLSKGEWAARSRLVVWTDGIRLPSSELDRMGDCENAGDWAENIVRDHGTDRDDGMLVVVTRGNGE